MRWLADALDSAEMADREGDKDRGSVLTSLGLGLALLEGMLVLELGSHVDEVLVLCLVAVVGLVWAEKVVQVMVRMDAE